MAIVIFNINDFRLSILVMQHKPIMCCDGDVELPPDLLHPSCDPIKIPKNDPFFSKIRRTCMNYVKSSTIINENCTLGKREQVTFNILNFVIKST